MSESFGIMRPRPTIITDYGWSSLPNLAAAPSWALTDTPAPQNVSSTTVTFSGVNIGAASADRIVVVCANTGSNVQSGCTIGGITATQASSETAGISALQMWYANVPTGTTATVVLTSSGTPMSNECIIVGALKGVTAAPPNSGSYTTNAADPANIAVTVPATGFAILALYGSANPVAWGSGATLDANTLDIGNLTYLSVAHAAASATVQASSFATANVHACWASWGP